MEHITIIPFGAGKDVGRSCILLIIPNRRKERMRKEKENENEKKVKDNESNKEKLDKEENCKINKERIDKEENYKINDSNNNNIDNNDNNELLNSHNHSTINILLDCGCHLGYNNNNKYPDFNLLKTYLLKLRNYIDINDKNIFNKLIDCVLITHFHLDHIGALPILTEFYNYNGPIYMTAATKSLSLLILNDYIRVNEDYSNNDIINCLNKVTLINKTCILKNAIIEVSNAGHALGAVMYYITLPSFSILYTGDYSCTPDITGSYSLPNRINDSVINSSNYWCSKNSLIKSDDSTSEANPTSTSKFSSDIGPVSILISESTYASTVRDATFIVQNEFIQFVVSVIRRGGKILLPVFALTRAQELALILEDVWERYGWKVPMFFGQGMSQLATDEYKLFASCGSESFRNKAYKYFHPKFFSLIRSKLFTSVSTFSSISSLNSLETCVLFATPGMLHGGLSQAAFVEWAGDPRNAVLFTGFCMQGSIGEKVQSGAKNVQINGKNVVIKLSVGRVSFTAHADAKGLMQVISQCSPQHVVLVHGEENAMLYFSEVITTELGINCHVPANFQVLTLDVKTETDILINPNILPITCIDNDEYDNLKKLKNLQGKVVNCMSKRDGNLIYLDANN